ncbi:IgGFc-binding protein [uncultured Roseobacter sp.]|nr:IgGFc-binding protein [uncultured Roseobacter sp.]
MSTRSRSLASLACASLALLLSSAAAHASFIANFHDNLVAGNNTLFIFGDEGTDGSVTGNDGFSQNFTIDNTGVFELGLGLRGREMTGNGNTPNNLSLLVESMDPISGLALNRGRASTDMTTLLDTDGLSSEYLVLTIGGGNDGGSQMSVTATEDNTTVTITAPVLIGGNVANTPFQVVLDAGESVFYETAVGDDLSGSIVSANNDVAVFAGARCADVPSTVTFCDHLIQQQFGTENFDTEFLLVETPFAGSNQDLVRVIAAEDSTEVFLDGVSQGTIDSGEVLQIDSVGNAKVTSDKPVSVGQFMRGQSGSRTVGDPAFALIPSIDQLLDAYSFTTPVGSDSFTQNQLNIAIAASDAASLELDGAMVDTSGFTLLDGILYGSIDVSVGSGIISAENPFLATLSGFDSFDSYLTPIASAFSPGVSPPPPPPPNPTEVVPLPASALLLLGGFGVMGALRRRKSRRAVT